MPKVNILSMNNNINKYIIKGTTERSFLLLCDVIR